MGSYRIHGGRPVCGEVTVSGNKNAALPCLAATLLTDETVVLSNVPDIEDVRVMCTLLRGLGSSVIAVDEHTVEITSGSRTGELDARLVEAVRGSILFLGPLLAVRGDVRLSPPGGDVIGYRRLDSHFMGLSALGASYAIEEDGSIHMHADHRRLKANDVFLDETSVTATENVIMASALAVGTSTIGNAASEPHVQDLCHLLVSMGCRISGIGSNLLAVTGTGSLHGCRFTLGGDFMEAGSYIGLAGATGGDVVIRGIRTKDLRMIGLGFHRIGIDFQKEGDDSFRVSGKQTGVMMKEIDGRTAKIDDAPWPGFPADLLSIVTVCATQMQGSILIHEKMFESRMYFVDWLIRMGADIILCDPHRAVVNGPTPLTGAVVTSPDVRAGMALVIAASCAHDTTVIENIYQIERGYDHLSEKLLALGLSIERLP